jgi:hypothetical protein
MAWFDQRPAKVFPVADKLVGIIARFAALYFFFSQIINLLGVLSSHYRRDISCPEIEQPVYRRPFIRF